MSSDPRPRDVVKFFMKKIGEVQKDVQSRNGGITRSDVTYTVDECPRGKDCSAGGSFESDKNKGYTNAYRHLISCLSSGKEKNLIKKYKDLLPMNNGPNQSTIQIHFQVQMQGNPREKAMFEYINLIVSLSLPVIYVQNPILRSFSKVDVHIGYKSIQETILHLVEKVEVCIKNDLSGTRGALMHDGWTDDMEILN